MMYSYRNRFAVSAVFGLMVLLGIGTCSAQALDINEIPQAFADAVGISDVAAGITLSAFVLLSVGLALSVSKTGNIAITVIVMIAMIGALTAIGWLEPWLLVMVVLVIALIFGNKLMTWGTQKA